MPSATANMSQLFVADPVLLKAMVDSVDQALTMCDTSVRCVAVSSVPARDPGTITGMIGVHGQVSGFITVNMAEMVATAAVGGLLQDHFTSINVQVIDGVGEMTNLIAGGIKKCLAGTPWAFSHVTVPSVIVGQNYQIAYSRGLEYLCVTFEHRNDSAVMLTDRMLQVAISLLRL